MTLITRYTCTTFKWRRKTMTKTQTMVGGRDRRQSTRIRLRKEEKTFHITKYKKTSTEILCRVIERERWDGNSNYVWDGESKSNEIWEFQHVNQYVTSSLHHLVDLALDVELGVLGLHTFQLNRNLLSHWNIRAWKRTNGNTLVELKSICASKIQNIVASCYLFRNIHSSDFINCYQ